MEDTDIWSDFLGESKRGVKSQAEGQKGAERDEVGGLGWGICV